MENFSETNEINGFETELNNLIQEVEGNKNKLKVLEKENEQLKIKNDSLKENEIKYITLLKKNETKIQNFEKQVPTGLSEKDLAEVMLDAKRVANDIIAKAKEEVKVFERQKQEAINAMRQEGKLIKEEVVNFKIKADQDVNKWIQSLEVLIGEPKE